MPKICLDPGHGGADPGAVLGKRYEKDDVLRLALAIKPLLEEQGVEVLMTRTDDKTVLTIAERCRMANAASCSYFLSIHRDAAGATAQGASAWVISSADAGTVQKAKTVLDGVIAAAGMRNRGVQKGAATTAYKDYGVNSGTNMASVLLEVGFVTNDADNTLFDRCFEDTADRIARGLCKIVDVEYRDKVADRQLTPIIGYAVAAAAQMRSYLLAKNPAAPDYVQLYLSEGAAEGVRGDIAFAQSCIETDYWRFSGDVEETQNNFCGLGATGNGVRGCIFPTPREGIRAQVQHLKGYATTAPLLGACADPRFYLLDNVRGKAPNVEWLGQRENPYNIGWATGRGYGSAVLKVLDAILKTAADDVPSKEYILDLADLKKQGFKSVLIQI